MNLLTFVFVQQQTGLLLKLMDILACPIDKYYPLELHVFEEKEEIVDGHDSLPQVPAVVPDTGRDS
jgi:hypothetical protein